MLEKKPAGSTGLAAHDGARAPAREAGRDALMPGVQGRDMLSAELDTAARTNFLRVGVTVRWSSSLDTHILERANCINGINGGKPTGPKADWPNLSAEAAHQV